MDIFDDYFDFAEHWDISLEETLSGPDSYHIQNYRGFSWERESLMNAWAEIRHRDDIVPAGKQRAADEVLRLDNLYRKIYVSVYAEDRLPDGEEAIGSRINRDLHNLRKIPFKAGNRVWRVPSLRHKPNLSIREWVATGCDPEDTPELPLSMAIGCFSIHDRKSASLNLMKTIYLVWSLAVEQRTRHVEIRKKTINGFTGLEKGELRKTLMKLEGLQATFGLHPALEAEEVELFEAVEMHHQHAVVTIPESYFDRLMLLARQMYTPIPLSAVKECRSKYSVGLLARVFQLSNARRGSNMAREAWLMGEWGQDNPASFHTLNPAHLIETGHINPGPGKHLSPAKSYERVSIALDDLRKAIPIMVEHDDHRAHRAGVLHIHQDRLSTWREALKTGKLVVVSQKPRFKAAYRRYVEDAIKRFRMTDFDPIHRVRPSQQIAGADALGFVEPSAPRNAQRIRDAWLIWMQATGKCGRVAFDQFIDFHKRHGFPALLEVEVWRADNYRLRKEGKPTHKFTDYKPGRFHEKDRVRAIRNQIIRDGDLATMLHREVIAIEWQRILEFLDFNENYPFFGPSDFERNLPPDDWKSDQKITEILHPNSQQEAIPKYFMKKLIQRHPTSEVGRIHAQRDKRMAELHGETGSVDDTGTTLDEAQVSEPSIEEEADTVMMSLEEFMTGHAPSVYHEDASEVRELEDIPF